MKVVVTCPWAYPFSGFGGTERYLYFLSKHLVERGIDVKIIASANGSQKRASYDGIEYEFVGPAVPTYRRYGWAFLHAFNVNLARHLRREEFDLLHSFHISAFAYLHDARRKPTIIEPFGLGKLCGLPANKVVQVARDILLRRPLRYCLQRADAIAADGVNQAAELADMFDIPNDKFFIIPDGVDLALVEKYTAEVKIRREDLGVHDADLVLVNVNRLAKNKGIPYLLDALSILNQRLSTKLIMIGDGPEEGRLNRQIRRLGLDDNVVRLKHISDEKMFQVLTLADLSVTPTLWEGIPLVMLEAMAVGKPVVATNIADIPSVVDGNGIIVPPMDAKAIAEAVFHIYQAGLIETMGARSKEIMKGYDWEIIADRAIEKYRQLLGDS